MVDNTNHFVYFFFTDNQEEADKWYNAIQQRRSWYLLYKLRTKGLGLRETIERVARADGTLYASNMFHRRGHFGRYTLPHDIQSDNNVLDKENRSRQVPVYLRNSIAPFPLTQYSRRDPAKLGRPALLDNDPLQDIAVGRSLERAYSQCCPKQQQRRRSARHYSLSTPGLLSRLDGDLSRT
jgi:hypothetical protein